MYPPPGRIGLSIGTEVFQSLKMLINQRPKKMSFYWYNDIVV